MSKQGDKTRLISSQLVAVKTKKILNMFPPLFFLFNFSFYFNFSFFNNFYENFVGNDIFNPNLRLFVRIDARFSFKVRRKILLYGCFGIIRQARCYQFRCWPLRTTFLIRDEDNRPRLLLSSFIHFKMLTYLYCLFSCAL